MIVAMDDVMDAGAAPAAYRSRIERLRELAVDGLPRMIRPADRLFAFRVRRTDVGLQVQGTSPRYTAMVLIGLAGESAEVAARALGGRRREELLADLLTATAHTDNLGDAAVTLWAASALGHSNVETPLRRLVTLLRADAARPTVELAWALSALCQATNGQHAVAEWRDRVAQRLLVAFDPRGGLFPHVAGSRPARFRGHVACFADLVYPILALAQLAAQTGRAVALDVANRCAARMCALQGPEGQWWWHYDVRTGRVVERYPAYAVHQDAMAPMALHALREAGGDHHDAAIRRGLDWLAAAPELDGGSLVDEAAGLIWRKVARREPRKLVRAGQAFMSGMHTRLRLPLADTLFPPTAIDYEDRPYHLGWVLYAWSPARLRRWGTENA